MNPVQLTHQLKDMLVSYLTTTFDVNRDGSQPDLATSIRFALDAPGALFNGPFLELTPPYIKGNTLRQLTDEGILSPELLRLECFKAGKPLPIDAPLYAHQEQAIRKIAGEGRSVVVSSGTGSGKTESFLIPILNDLLLDHTLGVRAVLIYPLNALVNDQLDRLRELLRDTDITFGRYTSELMQKTSDAREQLKGVDILDNEVISREQIRKDGKIPQILITNYAMLEYLLLRPEDSPLFNSGAWRFIVLDEAHTYSGSKGIEVSMLLRRLKLRLRKGQGDMRCIATSATLINEEPQQAVDFASHLFGEALDTSDIIFGQADQSALLYTGEDEFSPPPMNYLDANVTTLLRLLASDQSLSALQAADYLLDAGVIRLEDALLAQENMSPLAFLYEALSRNGHLNNLRHWMMFDNQDAPISIEEAANKLFSPAEIRLDADRLNALYHIVELGAQARLSEDSLPLLPARYHLFARPPQGVWVCLNPDCQGRETNRTSVWSKIFTAPRTTCDVCECAVYPLAVCRTCGQVYVYGQLEDDGRLSSEVLREHEANKRYFTWSAVNPNTSLAEEIDAEESATEVPPDTMTQHEVTLCLNDACRKLARCTCDRPKKVKLFQVEKQQVSKTGTRSDPLAKLRQCSRCNDSPRVQDTEIATPITITGNPPISVLTGELYRRLPKSTRSEVRGKPGGGRKLLTFYDSRQGAARFAAYLQDVVNQDLYRYVVPLAIKRLYQQNQRLPDFDELSQSCVEIGWNELQVFQNDLELENVDRGKKQLSQAERQRLKSSVQERLLAEITTNRRGRQSLESLGLIAVEYFETPPDVGGLSESICLSADQTHLLIRYLLDGLRTAKAVQMPQGVFADARVFGHPGNPSVVRSNPGTSEIPWSGKTARQGRYQLVQRALSHCGQPSDEVNVRRVLETIWEWLLEQDVLVGNASDGYRLSPNRLFFAVPAEGWYRCENCQRVRHAASGLMCPHPTCGGRMQPIDLGDWNAGNYYYRVVKQPMIPLRVEEHTAQLDSEKGRDYQNAFKRGDINILSCSTTFEMGIDLGDLQAVFLNNVPPTVANYRQRSGRAGRRAGGAAFIVTWAADRPHDQQYFSNPASIIRGHVRVPTIQLSNAEIRRRHINAILLGEFLRFRSEQDGRADVDKVGTFFDAQTPGKPHIEALKGWEAVLRGHLIGQLQMFASMIEASTQAVDSAVSEFVEALETERRRFESITQYYYEIERKMSANGDYDEAKAYQKLRERIREERLIDYLSNRGVLPSYSFPLATVELALPFKEQDKHLRLQRDLRYAIREYAPGAEVVADKRLWKSGGLQFYRDTPRQFHYRLCRNCNHLEMGREAGVQIPLTRCPTCGEKYDQRSSGAFITPDGFRATKDSGKPAGQYVHRPINLMRSGLLLKTEPIMEELGSLVSYGYSREGLLFYVNEGEHGTGFRICTQCGAHVSAKAKKCTGYYRGEKCTATQLPELRLGHTVQTDTLHIRLRSTAHVSISNQDTAFWQTLLYALLQGASRSLQIERQDISGLLHPIGTGGGVWEMSIVLYDTVPGGAGHVRDITRHFREVVREAYSIVSVCECAPNTSCVHCLRDHSNQDIYPDLQRNRVIPFLEALLADLENVDAEVKGAIRVPAINRPRWLTQHVLEAKDHVWIAANAISAAQIQGQRWSWIDLLRELLRRGVEVVLLLTDPPTPQAGQSEAISLARHLQTFLEDRSAFKLVKIDRLPEWQIVIDGGYERGRAIRATASAFALDEGQLNLDLLTTTEPGQVEQIAATMAHLSTRGKPITLDTLNPPPNTMIYNLGRMSGKREADLEPIQRFFAKPISNLLIHDPYLIDRERLFKRVSAYIDLAAAHGSLTRVTVRTRDARRVTGGDADEQNRAIRALETKYPEVIKVDRTSTEHDRWIEVEYVDGTKARMIIGRGLDFIRSDGTVEATYIVLQELVAR